VKASVMESGGPIKRIVLSPFRKKDRFTLQHGKKGELNLKGRGGNVRGSLGETKTTSRKKKEFCKRTVRTKKGECLKRCVMRKTKARTSDLRKKRGGGKPPAPAK